MKKFLLIIIFAVILTGGTVFAQSQDGLGIGVVGTAGGAWGSGFGYGGALSLKLPSVPVYWGISLDIWDGGMWLGVTGDFLNFFYSPLVKNIGLNWFLRFGLYGKIWIGKDDVSLGVGARLPVGLSWQPFHFLELFLDVAPSLGVSINPLHFPSGGWPIELGLRLWF
jgi:opacity protein-like surface antigen